MMLLRQNDSATTAFQRQFANKMNIVMALIYGIHIFTTCAFSHRSHILAVVMLLRHKKSVHPG